MRFAVIVLCLILAGCGIFTKKGRGTNIDPREPGPGELQPPHKRL